MVPSMLTTSCMRCDATMAPRYKQLDLCGNCCIDIFRKSKRLPCDAGVSAIIASFLLPCPHQLARRYHLWALLLSVGSPFRRLTYFFGGIPGNIDQHNDVIDKIIAYL